MQRAENEVRRAAGRPARPEWPLPEEPLGAGDGAVRTGRLNHSITVRDEKGFPVFDVPPGAPPITPEMVRDAEEDG